MKGRCNQSMNLLILIVIASFATLWSIEYFDRRFYVDSEVLPYREFRNRFPDKKWLTCNMPGLSFPLGLVTFIGIGMTIVKSTPAAILYFGVMFFLSFNFWQGVSELFLGYGWTRRPLYYVVGPGVHKAGIYRISTFLICLLIVLLGNLLGRANQSMKMDVPQREAHSK